MAGRARWKITNEHNNVLKTKGDQLEHNFGHGKEHLSSFLATIHPVRCGALSHGMNLLAFGLHTLLEPIYQPLSWLHENTPLDGPLDWYVELWE